MVFSQRILNFVLSLTFLATSSLLSAQSFDLDLNNFFNSSGKKLSEKYTPANNKATIEKEILSASVDLIQPVDYLEADINFETEFVYDEATSSVTTAMSKYGESWDTEHVRRSRYNFDKNFESTIIVLEHPASGNFVMPAKGEYLSQFGWRGKRMHQGMDIRVGYGDTIRAAFNGVVRMSKYYSGYGNCVVIRHPNGLETLYAHSSKNLVKVNDKIMAGQAIALGGSTGRSTCNHLHFETRFLGEPFDPARIISMQTYSLHTQSLVIDDEFFGKARQSSKVDRSLYANNTNVQKETSRTPAKNTVKPARKNTYVIKRGDTLYEIARRFGTDVKKICQINGINSNKKLKPGQKIFVS